MQKRATTVLVDLAALQEQEMGSGAPFTSPVSLYATAVCIQRSPIMVKECSHKPTRVIA